MLQAQVMDTADPKGSWYYASQKTSIVSHLSSLFASSDTTLSEATYNLLPDLYEGCISALRRHKGLHFELKHQTSSEKVAKGASSGDQLQRAKLQAAAMTFLSVCLQVMDMHQVEATGEDSLSQALLRWQTTVGLLHVLEREAMFQREDPTGHYLVHKLCKNSVDLMKRVLVVPENG